MIHFVTEVEQNNWIVRRIALELASRIPYSTYSTESDLKAQVNLFFPYYAYFFHYGQVKCPTPAISFFTHREEESGTVFDEVAERSTWCIAMCDKTAALLPPNKTTIIKMYPDKQFYKEKIVIGVVGKSCPSGRKRLELLQEVQQIPGVEVRYTGGALLFNQMPQFYKEIDYLLVTSNNEGGPMPVMEALAMGKPVIAPNVGFAWDFPVIKYDGTKEDLIRVVSGLVIDPNGWDKSAKELMEVIQKVCL